MGDTCSSSLPRPESELGEIFSSEIFSESGELFLSSGGDHDDVMTRVRRVLSETMEL